jgi:hypothetical protein
MDRIFQDLKKRIFFVPWFLGGKNAFQTYGKINSTAKTQ